MWSAALIPETPLDMNVAIPPLEEAVKQALAERPEVAETALALDINTLEYAPRPRGRASRASTRLPT